MGRVKTALRISGTLILLSFLISISIIYYLKLDNPVFLKSYKDIEVVENEGNYITSGYDIEIKYIANIEDNRKVSSIVFKDAPNLNFYVSENSPMGIGQFYNYSNDNIEGYGRYGIHTVFLNLNSHNYGYDLNDDIVLGEATVTFNDGLTMDVDLGKLVLYKYKSPQENLVDEVLYGQNIDISSEGISKSGFYVKKYIQVSDIYSKLFEDTRDLFDFNINKTGSIEDRDLIYNANDNLYFTSQFNFIDDPERKLYSYDIRPIIYFKDRDGKEYEKRVYNLTYNPSFNFNDIYKYLIETGEI
ncbi:hypothetical protein ACQPUY_11545 [Clostridium nigeriense]|uniref:hypothetical protein n=1 Tax=Clostridium nigeriense TaxID=1805470 RepID=UPI003D336DD5